MPELPEVERARRLAEKLLVGKRIVKAAAVNDAIVYKGISPRRFTGALRGRRVHAVRRRGKHIWMELDRRPWPTFHLGMTGSFKPHQTDRDRPRFWKIDLCTDDDVRLAMTNTRRLGRIRLLKDPEKEPPICKLGFDPLLDSIGPSAFMETLSKRKAAIKAALLDQSVAAGVGNWIADEALYQAHISPHRRTDKLLPAEAERLYRRLRAIIRKAVEVNADSTLFPKQWLFHYRWATNPDAVTHDGRKIRHEKIAGRTTAWVPTVQR